MPLLFIYVFLFGCACVFRSQSCVKVWSRFTPPNTQRFPWQFSLKSRQQLKMLRPASRARTGRNGSVIVVTYVVKALIRVSPQSSTAPLWSWREHLWVSELHHKSIWALEFTWAWVFACFFRWTPSPSRLPSDGGLQSQSLLWLAD